MSVPRSRSFLFFYKNKKYALSAYLKKLFWWSCRELPSGPKGNILAFYKFSQFWLKFNTRKINKNILKVAKKISLKIYRENFKLSVKKYDTFRNTHCPISKNGC